MYYGLQLATSGVLTSLYRADVMAGNLANIETTGYKPDVALARQRDVVRDEDNVHHLPSNRLLERLGAGVHMAPNSVDHTQGPLKQTGNDLDLALDGPGFFVLRDSSDGSTDAIRFSRDGRMTIDKNHRLVSATTGMPVVDRSNREIHLNPDAPVQVSREGKMTQNGSVIANLQIVDVPDRGELKKIGNSLYVPSTTGYENRIEATGSVEQGMLEGSSVNEINSIMQFQAATASVGTNTRMISYFDQMMNSAINTFSRTA